MTTDKQSLGAELRLLTHLARTDSAAALGRLHRALGVLRARWTFRRCSCGQLVNAPGQVRVVAEGQVTLGDRVQFWRGMIPQELICPAGAELRIGTLSMFNHGVSLRARRSIRIGERCMFGALVQLDDSNRDRTAPIVICDDVWVAHGAIIEPGVTIGEGSVVAAGSVVSEDVPAWSLAVGNPARSTPLPSGARPPGAPDAPQGK